jgi:hypothetical protein
MSALHRQRQANERRGRLIRPTRGLSSAHPNMSDGRCAAGLGKVAVKEAMSGASGHDLADFDNPPIVETVLSAQFERLSAMRAVHFGLFWQRVKDGFPNSEEHPALSPVLEQIDESVSQAVQLRFETLETFP